MDAHKSMDIHKIFSSFNDALESRNLDPENLRQIKIIMGLEPEVDLPIILIGYLSSMIEKPPKSYWDKEVMEEVEETLNDLFCKDKTAFIAAFKNSQEHFFAALKSYDYVVDIFTELGEVAYDEGLKTKIFKNTVYRQLCEDCLANFYRLIRDIFNALNPSKDYSNQIHLSQLIDILRKAGLSKALNINLNLRNAISHGDVFMEGSKGIRYKYRLGSTYFYKPLKSYEYDDLVNEALDIAGGTLMGIMKLLVTEPEIITEAFSHVENLKDETAKFEWVRLFYLTEFTQPSFIQISEIGSPQITIDLKISVDNSNLLIFSLIEILKGAKLFFPDYQRYMASYNHPRSLMGYIRVEAGDIDKDNFTIFKKALDRRDINTSEIQQETVNERAFKFHVFDTISGSGWNVEAITDISIPGHKRIKANLIVEDHCLGYLRDIIPDLIERLRRLYTPQNPQINVPFGNVAASVVRLQVFRKNFERRRKSLLTSDDDFICLAHYYQTNKSPRIRNGGVPASIWNCYIKEELDLIHLAWNPLNYQ